MHTGENISVIASFGPSYKVRPVRFRWSGKLFDVKEVTYSWNTRDGQKVIYHFSVTDGRTLYELTFDTHSLLWKIEDLET